MKDQVIDEATGEVVLVERHDSALVDAQRTEAAFLDVQVATAKEYPRSVAEFRSDLEAWSCEVQDIAKECTYSLPRGGKTIMGPSVRFAELAQQAYKNLVVETKVVDDGGDSGKRVVVVGTCRDLERNTASRAEVTRSIVDGKGKRYAQHMIETTIAAASAVARRNAIFQIIPRALWNSIYARSKDVMVGERLSHTERVANAKSSLKEVGVELENVPVWVGRRWEDMTVDDLVAVGLRFRAIKDGTVTAEEAFPAPVEEPEVSASKASDAIARAKEGSPASPKTPEPEPTEPGPMTEEEKRQAIESEKAEAEAERMLREAQDRLDAKKSKKS